MTVKELIAQLQRYDGDLEVVTPIPHLKYRKLEVYGVTNGFKDPQGFYSSYAYPHDDKEMVRVLILE